MERTSSLDLPEASFNSSSSSLESRYNAVTPDPTLQTLNTVEASISLSGHHQFNQLFNFVNHIDQIELDPHQTRSIIIAFLPDGRGHLNEESPDKHESANYESFDYFEVNGMLFFVCFKQASKLEQASCPNVSPDFEKTVLIRNKTDTKLPELESSTPSPSTLGPPDFQVLLSI